MAEPTANELLRDALVRHQIGLQRMTAGTRREYVRLLNLSEADMAAEIRRRTASGAVGPRRLEFLLDSVRQVRLAAHAEAGDFLADEMGRLARHEAEFAATVLEANAPVVLDTVLPDRRRVQALTRESAFQGRTLREWAESLADADLDRIDDQIKIGLIEGESGADIARRVVGSRDLGGTDGATQLTRNQADSLVRTAVNHYSNQARSMTFQENGVELEQYVATLDSRTTRRCASLDGRTFPAGEGPVPPLHWRCRSTRVPVLDAEQMGMGDRPMKAGTEREAVEAFAEENPDLEIDGRTRDAVPRGSKGDFDAFARRFVGERTGQVAGDTTYQQFLERQSVAFQEEVLGETRARLFRAGGLTLDRFVAIDGSDLTLAQLAVRERAAFRRAGLDWREFR